MVLAGCLSYSWWHGEAASKPTAVHPAKRFKGPLRVSAAALGISTDELVRALFTTKDVGELVQLAERLGIVGDDAAIDAVLPLVHDPKCRVQDALVRAFGAIGTEHAVDVLIELARDPRDDIRVAAASALGATASKRGERVLIEIAARSGDEARRPAIHALGELGSERAIEMLAQLAGHPDQVAVYAMGALARSETPAAHAALVKLVDAPSLSVAANAIGELTERHLDPDMIAKLTSIVQRGDGELVTPALGALAKTGDAGLPVVRAAALEGSVHTRTAAINMLGEIDSPQAVETLRTIVETEQGRLADTAANVLSTIDSDEAREALISAALADDTGSTRIVEYLLRQKGPAVEQALLVIAKSESGERWSAVEHLLHGNNPDALQLAVAQAHRGERADRLAAMGALANAGTEPALDALLELVHGSRDLKADALALLGGARPDDPKVAKLLREAVHSNVPEEAAAAASALARVGTEDARDALVAALASSDASVATNAATSLTKFRLTDEVTAALRGAMAAHPELKSELMTQLATTGSPLGLELAKEALAGDDPNRAYRALGALEQVGTPAAFELLVQGTRVRDPQVRAEAVASLAATADKRAGELVASALRDGEANVRAAAARALGQLGTSQARDHLITMTRSQDGDDRAAAVASLRRYEDADSARRLGELVRDPNPNVAYAAIDAVADRRDAVATLRGFLADTGAAYELRRQAALQLSYRGYTDPVIDALLEGD